MTKPAPRIRKFRVAPGATVTLPRATMSGPGGATIMFKGREVPHRTDEDLDEFEIEHDRVDRFIRQRVRSGDLVELETTAPRATAGKESSR